MRAIESHGEPRHRHRNRDTVTARQSSPAEKSREKRGRRSALLILPADVVGQQYLTRGHDYRRNRQGKRTRNERASWRGLTLAAGASSSFRAIVFASQDGVVWPFDITLLRGGAADGRLVENEA